MRSAITRIIDFRMRNKSGQIMCYKTGQFYLLTTLSEIDICELFITPHIRDPSIG